MSWLIVGILFDNDPNGSVSKDPCRSVSWSSLVAFKAYCKGICWITRPRAKDSRLHTTDRSRVFLNLR